MEYRIRVIANGRSAKNKGLVTGRATSHTEAQDRRGGWNTESFAIEAASHDEAFAKVAKLFYPGDKRPLAGKSYIRHAALKPLKLGAKVRTVEPYAFNPETGLGYRKGVVTEIVSERVVSVGFPGYHTQFVDFGLAELEAE
jgi:hypothetical protein